MCWLNIHVSTICAMVSRCSLRCERGGQTGRVGVLRTDAPFDA